jgi:PAS domain S-box-containing protein
VSDAEALDRYRTLVGLLDAGVYQLDQDGHFVAVNDSMVEMTGFSRDDLLGEPFSLLFSDSDAERGLQRVQDQADDPVTFESPLQTSDGRTIPCELRMTRLQAEDGLQGIVGVVRDLPEQEIPPPSEWTQRSGDVLSTTLEKIHGGIFVLDEEFKVVRTNETIGQYLGVDPSDLVGRDKRDIVENVMRDRVADPDRFVGRVLSA